jgi:signal transduction histidine kinase
MLQSAPWDSGAAPDGPAMTALRTIIARIAIIIRGTALAEMLVQVIIWHSFYLVKPWLLWGPVVALAWGSTAMVHLRGHRPSGRFACADSAVYAALALTAASCVPAAMRGEAGSWLFILVTSQVIVPVWFASERLSAPLAITPAIAFAVGTALVASTHLVTASLRNASAALLFLVVALHWLVRLMLRSRAVRADTALAAADRDACEQYVILSRNIEKREQDRLLHDTVLNTLTAIARSGSNTSIGQCRQDIAMLERALGESADAATGGPPKTGPLAAIAAVVSEMRARGLTVDLQIAGGGRPAVPSRRPVAPNSPAATPAVLPAMGGASAPASVPGPITAAVAQATREALANVAAHAGTGKAWVTASLTPPDEGGAARPGQLRVTIRDAGAGFDVSRVEPGRLGVRRSITERVEDWGGAASVQSAPGEGTTVYLSWPAASAGMVSPVVSTAGVGAGQGEGPW